MSNLPRPRFAASPLFLLAIALSAGIVLEHYLGRPAGTLPSIALAGGLAATFLSGLLVFRCRLNLSIALGLLAFVCAGFVLAAHRPGSTSANRIAKLWDDGVIATGDPVELVGMVSGAPEPAPGSFYLRVEVESASIKGVERNAGGTVLLLANIRDPRDAARYSTLDLRHGARIRVMTALDRDEDFRNPGGSPFTEYLERRGFDAVGVIKSPLLVERLDDARVFLPVAWIYELRTSLLEEFGAIFSPETAGVLDASLLGNRYLISRPSAERFRAGGTFHVLVISGLQIAFIGGVVFVMVRSITRSRVVQFLSATGLMWAYTIAVGADASVARAALMFTMVVFAPMVFRAADSLNAMGSAAIGLLVWQPSILFDPSFQLTFMSVLAIVTIAVPLNQKMREVGTWRPTRATPYPPVCSPQFQMLSEILYWSEREWRQEIAKANIHYRLFKTPLAARMERLHLQRPMRFAANAFLTSLSVQVGLLPLLIIYFHRLSLASLLLNIFVGVLMALLSVFALLAVLLSHVSAALAWPLILLAEKTNWLMTHAVDPFSRLGLASIRLPHYSGRQAAVYLLYYFLLGILVLGLRRWHPLGPVSAVNAGRDSHALPVFKPAALVFTVVCVLVLVHPFSAAPPDGRLHVDFLDVGQGDSALVTMPDGTTLLVDGGGRPRINRRVSDEDFDQEFQRDSRSIGEAVVSEFLWARGLDRVDYILATHADADHIDGLNDVARNFSVRGAIVARTPLADPEYTRFNAEMKAAGVPIQKIGAGDVLSFGTVTAAILWPPPDVAGNGVSGNNDSIVIRLVYGDQAVLLTGDIEKDGESATLGEGAELLSDVVKVGHHGSKTSSTEAFVTATHPSFAIISVGRNSIFGHPNHDVVERWRAAGARVLTTGERGTISVVTDGRALELSTYVR